MKSRSQVAVWILGVLVHGALLGLAALWYRGDLGGVPDDGPMPAPMLPAFLFGYRSGDTSLASWPLMRVWLLACAAYVVAPALVSVLSLGGPRDGAMFATVLLGLAWLVLPEPGVARADFVPSFDAHARSSGMLWLFALTSLGCALGALIRWRVGSSAPPEP